MLFKVQFIVFLVYLTSKVTPQCQVMETETQPSTMAPVSVVLIASTIGVGQERQHSAVQATFPQQYF